MQWTCGAGGMKPVLLYSPETQSVLLPTRCTVNNQKHLTTVHDLTTGSCRFLTEQIVDAQHFNLISKLPQKGDFQPQILYFWKNIF